MLKIEKKDSRKQCTEKKEKLSTGCTETKVKIRLFM